MQKRRRQGRKARPKHRNPQRTRDVTLAGPVTITRADGSVEVQPALTEKELRVLVKERRPFTERQKQAIRRRDGDRCRYCGGTGPFEFDHVVPVALGGRTSVHNGVLACCDCNRRKGAQVWKPRPLGVSVD